MTDREIERIIQEEPDEAKVMDAIREYRRGFHRINLTPAEDKQHICDLLCATLKATRDQHDLEGITYHYNGPDEQMVTVTWESGGTSVNVSLDSGIAMIRDILTAIK